MSETPRPDNTSGTRDRSGPPGKRASVEPPEAPPRESPAPLYQPGDIIAGKYRLTRVLGQGGMGAVWLARNLKLDVDVAIKLIRHELGTAEAAERLLQEARAAARIGHRSIVRIFDFGETELDDPFIVMEVLTGEPLRAVLERKGRLPAANAVRTLLPIASALAEAHAVGVVHRDLKPENVMLVPDKSGAVVPKLVDFGIAKFHRAEEPDENASRTGFVVGTPDYMAPEQAGGRDEVDERADVWALSVILYEAITGKVPFSGPNYAALIFAIMTAEASPVHEQMAGDAELWEILKRGLEKRRDARPTMRELGTELAKWALARGIESDIAGTSLAAHWTNEMHGSPFSALPPPVAEHHETPGEVVIPRPGGMPAGLQARGSKITITEAPPELAAPRPEEARGKSALWIAVAVVSTAVGALVAVQWRTPRPPPAPALPAVTASAPVVPASAPPEVPSSAPAPAATEAPSAEPAASVSAPATSASAARPGSRKPPRKSNLPIAKQPNF
jgi:serine/threonine-protein kinase